MASKYAIETAFRLIDEVSRPLGKIAGGTKATSRFLVFGGLVFYIPKTVRIMPVVGLKKRNHTSTAAIVPSHSTPKNFVRISLLYTLFIKSQVWEVWF